MQNLSKPIQRTDKCDIEHTKINTVKEGLKSVVMVTSTPKAQWVAVLSVYFFLYNRNRRLKIKLTLLGKNRQKKNMGEVKSRSKVQQKVLKTVRHLFFASASSRIVQYNVLSTMIRYMCMVVCSSTKSTPSH